MDVTATDKPPLRTEEHFDRCPACGWQSSQQQESNVYPSKHDIKRAERDVAKARDRLNALKDRRFVELEQPKLRKLIGKCYRYRNTYGGGDPEFWWLYIRVTGEDTGSLSYIAVERDSAGKVHVRSEQWTVYSHMTSSYEPISEEDYVAAVTPILDEIRALALKTTE